MALCLFIRDSEGVHEINYRAFSDSYNFRVPIFIFSQGAESLEEFLIEHDRLFCGISKVPFFREGDLGPPSDEPEDLLLAEKVLRLFHYRRFIDSGSMIKSMSLKKADERMEMLFEKGENMIYADLRNGRESIQFYGEVFRDSKFLCGSVKGIPYDLNDEWNVK